MTQRHECGGTYIGVSECTRREEYDGIGGGSKWGVSIYDGTGSPNEYYNTSEWKQTKEAFREVSRPIDDAWMVT